MENFTLYYTKESPAGEMIALSKSFGHWVTNKEAREYLATYESAINIYTQAEFYAE